MELRRKYRIFRLRDTQGYGSKWRSLPGFFYTIREEKAYSYAEEIDVNGIMEWSSLSRQMEDNNGEIEHPQPASQLEHDLRLYLAEIGDDALTNKVTLLRRHRSVCVHSFFCDLLPMFLNLRTIVLPTIAVIFYSDNSLISRLEFVAKHEPQKMLPRLQTLKWANTKRSSLSVLAPFISLPSMRNMFVSQTYTLPQERTLFLKGLTRQCNQGCNT